MWHAGFVALGSWRERKWYSFIRKQKFLATLILDEDAYETIEQVRWQVWHMFWHVLRMAENVRNGDFRRGQIRVNVRAQDDFVRTAHENMLADVFAAIMLYTEGYKGAINLLAKRRCQQAFEPILGYQAELYPYAIAAEATQMVLEEFSVFRSTKTGGPIARAIQIVEEVEQTFDDQAIKQWQRFAMAAQEMAWSGFERNKILQTAIYTSEDPYVRSMAYLTAEFLNSDPQPLVDFSAYNPFTVPEVNERLHFKRCEALYKDIMALPEEQRADAFLKAAEEQNRKLFLGDMTGWCVHALMAASEYFSSINDTEAAATQKPYMDQFAASVRAIEWAPLFTLGCRILRHRRNGGEVNAETVLELSRRDPALDPLIRVFRDKAPEKTSE